jgi:uncharacterized RDD family membrane protein YckC
MYNTLGRVPADTFVNAGFWRRCSAQLLDGLILLPITWLVAFTLSFGLFIAGFRDAVTEHTAIYVAVLAIGWLYFALQESSAVQASLGKRAFALKVVDEHLERIGFGRATFRYFVKVPSAFFFGAGFLIAGLTPRKQALHDMLAGTFVVFRGASPGEERPMTRPPMPWYGWLLNTAVLIYPIVLVAMTIPEYNNYSARVQIAEGMIASDAPRTAILDYYSNNDRCPASLSEAGLGDSLDLTFRYVGGVKIEPNCIVSVTFATASSVSPLVRGRRLELVGKPDAKGIFHWTCGGSLPAALLPSSCRN